MIKKISTLTGVKKWILHLFVLLSFMLVKSPDIIATNSAYGLLPSFLIIIAMGVFYLLIFEVLVGIFYSGLKEKIEKQITYQGYMNLFRFFVIFLNILIFLFSKIIILINFYINFSILFINLILIFIYLIFMWFVLKKYFIKENQEISKVCFMYFGFGFIYLLIQSLLWGSM